MAGHPVSVLLAEGAEFTTRHLVELLGFNLVGDLGIIVPRP